MFNYNWEAKIQERIGTLSYELYIFSILPNGKVAILKSNMDVVEIDEGDSMPAEPVMVLDKRMMGAVMEAMGKIGVEIKSDSFTKGKLEATEKHLEDMRELVFENNEVIIQADASKKNQKSR